jgi:hypothetical protein
MVKRCKNIGLIYIKLWHIFKVNGIRSEILGQARTPNRFIWDWSFARLLMIGCHRQLSCCYPSHITNDWAQYQCIKMATGSCTASSATDLVGQKKSAVLLGPWSGLIQWSLKSALVLMGVRLRQWEDDGHRYLERIHIHSRWCPPSHNLVYKKIQTH